MGVPPEGRPFEEEEEGPAWQSTRASVGPEVRGNCPVSLSCLGGRCICPISLCPEVTCAYTQLVRAYYIHLYYVYW